MKAIIPVAGIGSRLRPHTHTQPKALIPVAGKPILGHILDNLRNAGIRNFVFVVGYLGDKIEQYISQYYPNQKNEFIIQTTGKGIGHAIGLTKNVVPTEEPILIVLGDTIFEYDLKHILSSPHSMLGVKKVDDPRMFGVAERNQKMEITKLIEKPSIPKSNLSLVGVYFIKETAKLFDAIEFNIKNNIKTQNEFHLTDALMRMIEQGTIFKSFEVDNWFDCGKKEILLQTNELLLNRNKPPIPKPEQFENSILIQPVFLGKNAKVISSVIGPHVSIGDNAIIESSIISDSIIGPYAHIENANLKLSLIGNDSSLKGMVYTLNLGDSAEINFS
jgi:glucose-1-phosphate thymidylyltransferase